jgi:hypothetical protein
MSLRFAFWRAPTLAPLLPGPLRRLALILLLAWVAVPVLLALRFVGHGQAGSLDSAIDPIIMRYWPWSWCVMGWPN